MTETSICRNIAMYLLDPKGDVVVGGEDEEEEGEGAALVWHAILLLLGTKAKAV